VAGHGLIIDIAPVNDAGAGIEHDPLIAGHGQRRPTVASPVFSMELGLNL
jgi:hypothetical protein